MKILSSLADVAHNYSGFLIDLWGVMHGGAHAFPHALAALQHLRAHNKKIVLLSNAPRRAAIVAHSLTPKGISTDLYDAVLTSGEVTYQALVNREDAWMKKIGNACYFLGEEYHFGSYHDLSLTFVDDIQTATFVLVTGSYDQNPGLNVFIPLLKEMAARPLPMICANPDKVVIHHGEELMCPGTIADAYEKMGGDVKYFGKPDPAIFSHAMTLIGTAPHNTLMIGDGLATDIAGAMASGMHSVWISHTGIFANQVPDVISTATDVAHILGNAQPTYVLQRLCV
ncbi:MAG: TIGR01459 family HAD-type hydrolase [Alphaproteobacteria bacterium]|nr:TIGR01459 family HAD-type hydrolase [Alphaproteobacteria bacterium]